MKGSKLCDNCGRFKVGDRVCVRSECGDIRVTGQITGKTKTAQYSGDRRNYYLSWKIATDTCYKYSIGSHDTYAVDNSMLGSRIEKYNGPCGKCGKYECERTPLPPTMCTECELRAPMRGSKKCRDCSNKSLSRNTACFAMTGFTLCPQLMQGKACTHSEDLEAVREKACKVIKLLRGNVSNAINREVTIFLTKLKRGVKCRRASSRSCTLCETYLIEGLRMTDDMWDGAKADHMRGIILRDNVKKLKDYFYSNQHHGSDIIDIHMFDAKCKCGKKVRKVGDLCSNCKSKLQKQQVTLPKCKTCRKKEVRKVGDLCSNCKSQVNPSPTNICLCRKCYKPFSPSRGAARDICPACAKQGRQPQRIIRINTAAAKCSRCGERYNQFGKQRHVCPPRKRQTSSYSSGNGTSYGNRGNGGGRGPWGGFCMCRRTGMYHSTYNKKLGQTVKGCGHPDCMYARRRLADPPVLHQLMDEIEAGQREPAKLS